MTLKAFFKNIPLVFTSIITLSVALSQGAHATFPETFETFTWRTKYDAWQGQQQVLCNGYLDLVDTQFRAATTDDERRTLVTDAFNLAYLRELKTIGEIHEGLLRAHVSEDPLVYTAADGKKRFNNDKSTPIALAIGLMRVDLVRAWLPFIPDVNARHLTAWGYRQPYTLGHHAIDPSYPNIGTPLNVEAAQEIIDLLHARGIDWHADIESGIYSGPPLGAGNSRDPKFDPLTIRGLLYGVKPDATGASCHNTMRRLRDDRPFVDGLYEDAKTLVREKKPLSPMPPVACALEEKRVEEIAFLTGFSFVS